MEKRWTACFVVSVSVGWLVGCDTSDGSQPPGMEPDGECSPEAICEPQDFPFVHGAFPSTDSWNPGDEPPGPGETTAVMHQPETGKVCMKGRIESGWGFLTLAFARFDGTELVDPLDAPALGITNIEFALESPPPFGISVQLVSLVPGCEGGPVVCQHWGFYLSDGDSGNVLSTNQSGVVNAAIADFVKTPIADASWTFDPSHLSTLQIGAGAFGAVTGDYDFCVKDLRFLDATGAEVSPPG